MIKVKIVGIGGGFFYKNEKGNWTCSCISSIKRIIELSNKNNPNVLLLAHAAINPDIEKHATIILSEIFEELGCNVKILLKEELKIKNKSIDFVDWSDVIYEDGGCTQNMVNLWNSTGFSALLRNANDKVLSGLSAGSCCWFSNFNCRKENFICEGKGFSLIDAYFVPHATERDRISTSLVHLKENGKVGLFIPDNCAIEIVDDKYQIIYDDFGFELVRYHAKSKYYENDCLISHDMYNFKKYKSLKKLMHK